MADRNVSSDALRFVAAGIINTVVTSIIYFSGLVLMRPAFSYTLAWLVGLLFVMKFYPERVFVGARATFGDRLAIGGTTVGSFAVGLLVLHHLSILLDNVVAFVVALVLTTAINFALSRWVLRQSPDAAYTTPAKAERQQQRQP